MSQRDEGDFLELVAFLLASARNLISEPPRYGPLRLVEAMRRLIEVLEQRGIATTFLLEIASSASEMPSRLMRSEEEFIEGLDELVDAVAARLTSSSAGSSPSS